MESGCEVLKVTFFPPLHHQRRIWVLDILRRERLTEILDIGCGEGALLSTLCQPAPWLRPRHFEDDDDELSSRLYDVGLNGRDTPDLHATRIVGLDMSSSQLDIATQYTSPASINPLYTRWEPLDVELWQGSVDTINPAFVNVQCIVASELIEHLTDSVLVQVAPVVLGIYQPRVFLVTTPSYTFNQRWAPPGSADPNGFLDPSGRTDRVFRHSDHKFEWTVDEFVQWCKSVAQQWGYTVETTTIGEPTELDPWGRDSLLGGATQVACFKRLDNQFSKVAREHGTQDLRRTIAEPHTLVARHHHEAHSRAGYPSGLKEIEEALVLTFQQWGETTLRAQELWFASKLSILCGGFIDVMLNAAEQSTKLELQRDNGQPRENWEIRLVAKLSSHFLAQITPVETESIMYDEDEAGYDVEECSFDSGLHMGVTNNATPWCPEDICWTQVSGGSDSWATD